MKAKVGVYRLYSLLILLAASLFLTAFGWGGGGGGSSSDSDKPRINSYELYDVDPACANLYGGDVKAIFDNCTTIINDATTYIGDLVMLVLYCYDGDQDPYYVIVRQYKDGVLYYENIIYFYWMTSQQCNFVIYVEPVDIFGPAGNWRIDVQLFDEAGHASNLYSFNMTTYNSAMSQAETTYEPDIEIMKEVLEAVEGQSVVEGLSK